MKTLANIGIDCRSLKSRLENPPSLDCNWAHSCNFARGGQSDFHFDKPFADTPIGLPPLEQQAARSQLEHLLKTLLDFAGLDIVLAEPANARQPLD